MPDYSGLKVFLVFLAVIFGMIGYLIISGGIHEYKRKKLGRRLIEVAKIYGVRFYRNVDQDIVAVCTKRSFNNALIEHHELVKHYKAKLWDKVICYAYPTFTFAGSEQTLRPIHTGLRADLEKMIEGVMRGIYGGIKREEVSGEDYDEAASIIFVKDTRLFVPYSGFVSDPEKHFARFGETNLEEAIRVIDIKL